MLWRFYHLSISCRFAIPPSSALLPIYPCQFYRICFHLPSYCLFLNRLSPSIVHLFLLRVDCSGANGELSILTCLSHTLPLRLVIESLISSATHVSKDPLKPISSFSLITSVLWHSTSFELTATFAPPLLRIVSSSSLTSRVLAPVANRVSSFLWIIFRLFTLSFLPYRILRVKLSFRF